MRLTALSLILALAPAGAACSDPGKPGPSASTGAPRATALEPCPKADVCDDLGRYRVACKPEAPTACDLFVAAFERLLGPCDCTGRHPGMTDCTSVLLYSCTNETFDASLVTLAGLAKSKSDRALRLFASQKFRDMLSGEYADVYFEDSVNADRVLRGVPPRPPYEEPVLSATASSTLRPQGGNRYHPALALDDKRETAWCEGARGDGVGEWIEVRARHLPDWKSPLCEVLIVPGYAKSEAVYSQNGRITRLRISSCAHPEASFEADVDSYHFNLPYPLVKIPSGALKGEADCFRLTILAVAKGRAPDTCISEILPVFCEPKEPGDGGTETERR